MLTLIRRIAGHLAMVLGILSVACFANSILFDESLGRGVYAATVWVSIFLQVVVGINLYCLLELKGDEPLLRVQSLHGMNMFLIIFISFSLITISLTFNSKFLLALLPLFMNFVLSHRIFSHHKKTVQKT